MRWMTSETLQASKGRAMVLLEVLVFAMAFATIFVYGGNVYCKFCVQANNPVYEAMSAEFGYACSTDDKCSFPIILLRGIIQSNSDEILGEQMKKIIQKHPQVNTICFDSLGGYNTGAVALSNRIIQLGLNTCLAPRYLLDNRLESVRRTSVCASLCGWLLSAGKHRIAFSPLVKVGFHASGRHFHKCLPTHFAWKHEESKAFFAEDVLPRQFDARHESLLNRQRMMALLDWSFGIDPISMKWKEAKELMDDYGYFDELISPGSEPHQVAHQHFLDQPA